MNNEIKVALAGQQNAGKSTLFNLLTGARQHVANYPGVTVDKKYGRYSYQGNAVLAVDLPGTYSLTSFSLEERVARDFLLRERPDVAVNVVDASNLRRSLHLTFQLLEMGLKSVLALNMMDMAKSRGIAIDVKGLAERLRLPVVETVGSKGVGRDALRGAIQKAADSNEADIHAIDYGSLEPMIAELSLLLRDCAKEWHVPSRWLAIKLLEDDSRVKALLEESAGFDFADRVLAKADQLSAQFMQKKQISASDHIVMKRDQHVTDLLKQTVSGGDKAGESISNRIDRFVLNRWAAPLFLVLTVFLIYQISIVWGGELTEYTWPILAGFRDIVASVLPSAGFLEDPYTRSLGLWLVDSAIGLLNYAPIFFILFVLIAILEDSGYMARIAFILDKVLHRFGLHGQSTLPLILGGVFAGGCAVPGIMATKGIPDNRARMATIMAVPFMNCLAKVPVYALLLGIFFAEDKSLMMFYISTLSIIIALLIAKLLAVTVLKGQETSPFVMELPKYHLPTVSGVLQRAMQRTWIYIKKVGTIVVALSVLVFALLHFPGLSTDQLTDAKTRSGDAISEFQASLTGTGYEHLGNAADILPLISFYNDYHRAIEDLESDADIAEIQEQFHAKHADFLAVVSPTSANGGAAEAHGALESLVSSRKTIRHQMSEQLLTGSALGSIGRALESVTHFSGFDWKINIAMLTAFTARENAVATFGVLYQQDEDSTVSLEQRMRDELTIGGATSLLAVSMILFFALYPPCLASTVMIKVQTGSYRWTLFAVLFPVLLGLIVSGAVYTIGSQTGMSGIEMMTAVYVAALALLIVVGLLSGRREAASLRQLLSRPEAS